MTKQQWIWRITFYLLGVLCLATGVTFGNMAALGVSPINSVPRSISGGFGLEFSKAVLVYYTTLIILQFLIRGKKHRRWRDLAQLPFSLVFSALLDVFAGFITLQADTLWQRGLLMAGSILSLGVGVAVTVSMQIVPNPAEGMLEALCLAGKKEMGLTKNLLDCGCVAAAFLIDLLFGTVWYSIGIGTVVAMVVIGRIVAVFNRFARPTLLRMAGLN